MNRSFLPTGPAVLLLFFLSLSVAAKTLPIPLPATPLVATSILPIQMLVRFIAEPDNPPILLLPVSQSPHDYLLRPSEMRTLRESQLVFWIGPQLEGFLVRPLAVLPLATRVVTLQQLANRTTDHESDDPHLWLDPGLVSGISRQIADALIQVDPAHRSGYLKREHKLQQHLAQLDKTVRTILEPVRQVPFIVYHDGYRRLARHYGLNLVTAVTLDPDRPVSLRRLQEIRQIIKKDQVVCLFSEPQFPTTILRPLVHNGLKIGILDPLGSTLPAGEQTYELLLRTLAISLRNCLKESSQ